jgi:DNA-directed RNA polymerase subunit RPC12/RpoP
MITKGDRLGCERCSHKWVARKDGRPEACPRCNSRLWDAVIRERVRPGPQKLVVDEVEDEHRRMVRDPEMWDGVE